MEAASTTFGPGARGAPTHPTFIRWLWLWITVGTLVVLVVVGFLLGIVSALHGVNGGLAEANASVTGIREEANPLPTYIQEINGNLTRVDTALKPLSYQANQIIDALSSIRGGLGQVQASLVDTSGSLRSTSASLVDTSGTLASTSGILGAVSSTLAVVSGTLAGVSGTLSGVSGSLADTSGKLVTIAGSLSDTARKLVATHTETRLISRTLTEAETVPTNGTQAIWRRVRFINGGSFGRPGLDNSLRGPGNNPAGLMPINGDAKRIFGGLVQVNGHLLSICQSRVLNTPVPGFIQPGPC